MPPGCFFPGGGIRTWAKRGAVVVTAVRFLPGQIQGCSRAKGSARGQNPTLKPQAVERGLADSAWQAGAREAGLGLGPDGFCHVASEFEPGDDNLFMFKNNQCKPECCGSSFSCGGGCVCTSPKQRNLIAGRGGNRTEPAGDI